MTPNKQQLAAINTIKGPVMIISCAGSGKTTVIVERTKKILESGVSASKVLVVTFSKAAATEMEERFVSEYNNTSVKFSTIHSICYSILANSYGMKADSILKPQEKKAFLRETYIELKRIYGKPFEDCYDDMDDFIKDIELKLSGYKALMYRENKQDVDKVIQDRYVAFTYKAYCEFKKSTAKIDFDDMIVDTHKCLSTNPAILDHWRSLVEYIMIDEFQDTNMLQAEIFYMLAGEKKNICVVGDDDQSIYSFRDADTKIFVNFLERYPNAKKIFLEINYRSEPQIVKLASNVIQNNVERFPKKFKASKTGKAKVLVYSMDYSMTQTDAVVNKIKSYQADGIPLSEIAVLYRVKKEATLLCNRLLSEKILFYTKELPEDLHSGMVYRDIKAYYRLANDLWDRTDLRRIINRPNRYIKGNLLDDCGLNKTLIIRKCTAGVTDGERKEQIAHRIEQLFTDLHRLRGKKPGAFMAYLKDNMKYRDALTAYAEFLKVGDRPFLDAFDELMKESEMFDTMAEWNDYAEQARKKLLAELEKNKKNGVYLSTFHGAKGLQWRKVIIISANDGVTPLIRCDEIENPEEERRLFYVAMTRAKEDLTIVSYGNTGDKDNSRKVMPSRYIGEMRR